MGQKTILVISIFIIIGVTKGLTAASGGKANCDTPLHKYVRSNDLVLARRLVETSSMTMYRLNCHGELPLQLAFETDSLEMFNLFHTHGFNMSVRLSFGNSLLHAAVSKSALNVMRRLIEVGVPVDVTNEMMLTPLAVAVIADDQSSVNVLLACGANADWKTHFGETYLHLAARFGRPKSLKALFRSNLRYTMTNQSQEIVKLATLSNEPMTLQVLKDRGFDISEMDASNRTLLHEAAYGGKSRSVNWLLQNGHKVNRQDSYGMSSLHLSAISGDRETVREILRRQALINLKDNFGHTPLYYATKAHHESIAEFIRDRGGDIL